MTVTTNANEKTRKTRLTMEDGQTFPARQLSITSDMIWYVVKLSCIKSYLVVKAGWSSDSLQTWFRPPAVPQALVQQPSTRCSQSGRQRRHTATSLLLTPCLPGRSPLCWIRWTSASRAEDLDPIEPLARSSRCWIPSELGHEQKSRRTVES